MVGDKAVGNASSETQLGRRENERQASGAAETICFSSFGRGGDRVFKAREEENMRAAKMWEVGSKGEDSEGGRAHAGKVQRKDRGSIDGAGTAAGGECGVVGERDGGRTRDAPYPAPAARERMESIEGIAIDFGL